MNQLTHCSLVRRDTGKIMPIASNDTAEGRDKNRRVEVLIQPLVLQDGITMNNNIHKKVFHP